MFAKKVVAGETTFSASSFFQRVVNSFSLSQLLSDLPLSEALLPIMSSALCSCSVVLSSAFLEASSRTKTLIYAADCVLKYKVDGSINEWHIFSLLP